MGYKLTPPMIVTPGRRLPGARIGGTESYGERTGGVILSVEEVPDMHDHSTGRPYLRVYADREWTSARDSETGEVVRAGQYGVNETHVPSGGTVSERARDRIDAVLAFLQDDARRFDQNGTPEDGWTFTRELAAWASHHADEIERVRCELDAQR